MKYFLFWYLPEYYGEVDGEKVFDTKQEVLNCIDYLTNTYYSNRIKFRLIYGRELEVIPVEVTTKFTIKE